MSRTTVKQEWAAGDNVLSQTLGVAAPSTFSLHRIHLLTFRHQTILPRRDDHPPAHMHSHTHAHQPQEPSGRRNSSNKAICCPPRCYGNWADVHSGLKCFPWIPSAGGGFVCWNASQELTRCVRPCVPPAPIDRRAVLIYLEPHSPLLSQRIRRKNKNTCLLAVLI